MQDLTINFFLAEPGRSLGELDGFVNKIIADADGDIIDLKNKILERVRTSWPARTAALESELLIWKLITPVKLDPFETLGQRLPTRTVSEIAIKLGTCFDETIFDIFDKQPPPKGYVHLIVQFPSATISPSSSATSVAQAKIPPFVPETISPRTKTVENLYEIMHNEHLVHVRGTPGSGKTILHDLLFNYISQTDPTAPVYSVKSWQQKDHYDEHLQALDPFFPHARDITYLLFDEGQDLYWDASFWNDFLKKVSGRTTMYRIILFCSYGSPSSRPVTHFIGTPLALPAVARVSLWPRDGEAECGLCFTWDEFDDVVRRHADLLLHRDLQKMIYDWSAGQVGATMELLRLIAKQYKGDVCQGKQITCEIFLNDNPVHNLVRNSCTGVFARGLPSNAELRMPNITKIFRKILRNGAILDTETVLEEDKEALFTCNRHGWVHGEITEEGVNRYVFPSPFYTMRLSWQLLPTDAQPTHKSLLELSLAVICNFKPSQLSIPIRRAGVPIRSRPREAQYQDEYYQGLFDATGGNVCTSPEFASAQESKKAGRIDFFIPIVKWGIEITRDGSKLAEHASHFLTDGAWLKTGEMSDYLLLDFRTSMPCVDHSVIQNLYYIIFTADYSGLSIYDNKQKCIKGPICLH